MAEPNEWAHLVKPFVVKEATSGLYQQPRIWAEGKDWEGFNANFSFGFFTEPGVCHPIEGAVAHPYDEVLVFAGTDLADILAFGGRCRSNSAKSGRSTSLTRRLWSAFRKDWFTARSGSGR